MTPIAGGTGPTRVAVSLALLLALAAALLGPVLNGSAQDDIVGDYSIIFGSEELDQDVANAPALAGRWRLSFAEDGTFEAERLDVGVLVSGTYELEGDTITVTDEEGVLSCASPVTTAGAPDDVATGTYRFEVDSGRLTMTVEEDGCDLRRILFASKEFAEFVACVTALAAGAATPVAGDDEADDAAEASPEADGGLLDFLTPAAGAGQSGDDEEAGAQDDQAAQPPAVEEQIDELLGQMTACWSTGNPARFLPLLSDEFRETFADADALESLQTDDDGADRLGTRRRDRQRRRGPRQRRRADDRAGRGGIRAALLRARRRRVALGRLGVLATGWLRRDGRRRTRDGG